MMAMTPPNFMDTTARNVGGLGTDKQSIKQDYCTRVMDGAKMQNTVIEARNLDLKLTGN